MRKRIKDESTLKLCFTSYKIQRLTTHTTVVSGTAGTLFRGLSYARTRARAII